jgi:hypothetical protein
VPGGARQGSAAAARVFAGRFVVLAAFIAAVG